MRPYTTHRGVFRLGTHLSLILSGVLALAILPGCARREIIHLQDQVTQLQDFEKEFKSENYELSSTINRNLGRLREQLEHAAKTIADLNAKLDIISDEHRVIRGKLEELLHEQTKQTRSPTLFIPPQQTVLPTDPAPGVAAPDDLAEKLYNNAYNDFIKGNYELAIVGFQDFIKQFSRSDMADNAQYWIGECYYTQGKYEQAIAAFDKVLKDYPSGDKLPPSLLKKGYSLLESGKIKEGKEVLNGLLTSYPHSEEASLADERLKHTR